jgi:hypothetical protein
MRSSRTLHFATSCSGRCWNRWKATSRHCSEAEHVCPFDQAMSRAGGVPAGVSPLWRPPMKSTGAGSTRRLMRTKTWPSSVCMNPNLMPSSNLGGAGTMADLRRPSHPCSNSGPGRHGSPPPPGSAGTAATAAPTHERPRRSARPRSVGRATAQASQPRTVPNTFHPEAGRSRLGSASMSSCEPTGPPGSSATGTNG